VLLVVAAAEDHGVDEIADDAREEHDEGVHHALHQRQSDHVAVGHVRDLVAQHGFHFVAVHVLQQSGGHGHQRRVAERAGGEGIRRSLVDRDVRTADAGAQGELLHGGKQPGFVGVARRVDDMRAGGPPGQRFRDQQRDDRAGETDHQREDQQRAHVDTVRRQVAIHAEQPQRDRQNQHHREVGGEEEEDALHRCSAVCALRFDVGKRTKRGGAGLPDCCEIRPNTGTSRSNGNCMTRPTQSWASRAGSHWRGRVFDVFLHRAAPLPAILRHRCADPCNTAVARGHSLQATTAASSELARRRRLRLHLTRALKEEPL
jgi:hypothetical protein